MRIKNKIWPFASAALILLLCPGCLLSAPQHAPVAVNAQAQPRSHAYSAMYPAIFNVAQGLALQLQQNLRDGSLSEHPCIVTTLADIDDLSRSSRFGRVMAEALGAEIFRQGGVVREARMTGSIALEPGEGEFALSRNAVETAKSVAASAVVAGTYGVGIQSVAVTVKLVDITTGNVLSVAMAEIARTPAVDSLLDASSEPTPTVYDRL